MGCCYSLLCCLHHRWRWQQWILPSVLLKSAVCVGSRGYGRSGFQLAAGARHHLRLCLHLSPGSTLSCWHLLPPQASAVRLTGMRFNFLACSNTPCHRSFISSECQACTRASCELVCEVRVSLTCVSFGSTCLDRTLCYLVWLRRH